MIVSGPGVETTVLAACTTTTGEFPEADSPGARPVELHKQAVLQHDVRPTRNWALRIGVRATAVGFGWTKPEGAICRRAKHILSCGIGDGVRRSLSSLERSL